MGMGRTANQALRRIIGNRRQADNADQVGRDTITRPPLLRRPQQRQVAVPHRLHQRSARIKVLPQGWRFPLIVPRPRSISLLGGTRERGIRTVSTGEEAPLLAVSRMQHVVMRVKLEMFGMARTVVLKGEVGILRMAMHRIAGDGPMAPISRPIRTDGSRPVLIKLSTASIDPTPAMTHRPTANRPLHQGTPAARPRPDLALSTLPVWRKYLMQKCHAKRRLAASSTTITAPSCLIPVHRPTPGAGPTAQHRSTSGSMQTLSPPHLPLEPMIQAEAV